MMTEYALAKGQMVYTRRARLGENEYHEFTAQIPYSFNTNDDYLVSKEIIDRAADDVVALTMSRLGLGPTLVAEVVKGFLETTEERTKARRQARKAEKAVAVEPQPASVAEHVPDQYNEQPAAEVTNPHGLFVDTVIDAGPINLGADFDLAPVKVDSIVEPVPEIDADPLLAGSDAAAGGGSEPSSEFDLDAELAAVPDEIDDDTLRQTVEDWCRGSKSAQKAVVAVRKLLMSYATQVSAIPQERRADFLSKMRAIEVA